MFNLGVRQAVKEDTMRSPTRLLLSTLLGGATLLSVAPSVASADPVRKDEHHEEKRKEEHHEEKRREEHHEERREERHDERRAERHEERREINHEIRHDRLHPYEAPPALRAERHEERHGYAWINGRYDWRDGRYSWVGGRYEHARPGFMWREPRWEMREGAYVRVEGEWYSPGPSIAPPILREEHWDPRPGFAFVRGRWGWRNGEWAWTGGHYEREHSGMHWREPRWEQREGVYVSVDGAWEP
jgi:WXXGXW repeat (2 copies)